MAVGVLLAAIRQFLTQKPNFDKPRKSVIDDLVWILHLFTSKKVNKVFSQFVFQFIALSLLPPVCLHHPAPCHGIHLSSSPFGADGATWQGYRSQSIPTLSSRRRFDLPQRSSISIRGGPLAGDESVDVDVHVCVCVWSETELPCTATSPPSYSLSSTCHKANAIVMSWIWRTSPFYLHKDNYCPPEMGDGSQQKPISDLAFLITDKMCDSFLFPHFLLSFFRDVRDSRNEYFKCRNTCQ